MSDQSAFLANAYCDAFERTHAGQQITADTWDAFNTDMAAWMQDGTRSNVAEYQAIFDTIHSQDDVDRLHPIPPSKGLLGMIWDNIVIGLKSVANFVWSGADIAIENTRKKAAQRIANWIQTSVFGSWDQYVAGMRGAGWFDDDTVNGINNISKNIRLDSALVQMMIRINIIKKSQDLFMANILAHMEHSLAAVFRPTPLDAGSAVKLAFVAPDRYQEAVDALRKNGLSDLAIDQTMIANYALLSEQSIRMALWRGNITSDDATIELRKHGYTDTRISAILATWLDVPSLQELIGFADRGAMSDTLVAQFGLSANFPETLRPIMHMLGLDDAWLDLRWASHWQQPATEQVEAMRHRGIIDDSTADAYYDTTSIAPFWRDKIKAYNYLPLPRLVISRLYHAGEMTAAEVYDAFTAEGFSPDNARKLAAFVIAYPENNVKELSVAEVLTGYSDGYLSIDDAKAFLLRIGYAQSQVDYLINKANHDSNKTLLAGKIKAVQAQFTNGQIDRNAAQTLLDGMGIRPDKVTIYLDTWAAAQIKLVSLPSKSELDALLKDNIITLDQYGQELTKLGYSATYVAWFVLDKTPKPGA